MNILQFEPPKLEFICKRYEIYKFWNSKPQIKPTSVIKIKSRGISARNQGLRRKKNGLRVDSRKPEWFFNKISKRRGIMCSRPFDHRSTDEIRSEGERARAGASEH